jgi:hypothetical protein
MYQVRCSSEQLSAVWAAGVTAPEEFGGLDMGYQAHCIAMEVSLNLVVAKKLRLQTLFMLLLPAR